jgi:hypothetical protein
MTLSSFLQSYQGRKLISKDIKPLLTFMHNQKLQSCLLWKISPFTRIMTVTAKLQSIFIILAGLLFIPPTLYEKYIEDKSKLWKICIYAPVAATFFFAPLALYRRNVRKVLT